jgi:hypothetical protein
MGEREAENRESDGKRQEEEIKGKAEHDERGM